MKKKYLILLAAIGMINTLPAQSYQHQQSNTRKKDEVMLRDQIDDTDTLAIPLDSSEIEDEEQINRLEGREVFKIPERSSNR